MLGGYLYTVMFVYDLFLKSNTKLKIELLLPSILIFKYPKNSMALSFLLMMVCGLITELLELPSTFSLWALLVLYLFIKRFIVIRQEGFVNITDKPHE